MARISRPGTLHLGGRGGPVPAWIASVGVVAGVLLVLPVLLLGLHLFSGNDNKSGGHPVKP